MKSPTSFARNEVFMAKTSIGITPVLMWSVDVTSWLRECWHGVGANRVLTWLHKCWHGFNTNEVLSWLHGKDGCWHDFNINGSVVVASCQRWMLARLRCKWSFDVAQCKYWCNFNASASANVEYCRGFMIKMNVGIASVRMKCWRGFVAKTSIGMTSVLMWSVIMASWQKWIVDIASWLRCKWNVVVASWKKWMLAQLRYEWSVDVASI